MSENEFEQLAQEGAPEQTFSETPQDDVISSGDDLVYDINQAPDYVKAPPREDLDGKEVTVIKSELILPRVSDQWEQTKVSKIPVKYARLKLTYDIDGQQENYSGFRIFKRDDGKYSHPTFTRDGKNQVSALVKAYAKFRKKDINEVSLKEFLSFLDSKPKAIIKAQEFENPSNDTMVKKNIIGEFI